VDNLTWTAIAEGDEYMVSIGKRAAGIGAVVAMIAAVGPVSLASASTGPIVPPAPVVLPAGPIVPQAPVGLPAGPINGAFQAGLDAEVGGLNAGTDAAVGGWNAGAAALGVASPFTVQQSGPLGLHVPAMAPLTQTP
jgi:hypothetical protein